jgi:HEAT repeat protein
MRAWVRAGCVLAVWLALIFVENGIVGLGFRDLFAGSWEMALARRTVTWIALGALLPAAGIATAASLAAERSIASRRARAALAGASAIGGALTAYGVSFGRHMASWVVRAPFIAIVTLAAFGAAWVLVPRVARVALARPRTIALAGIAAACALWCADAFVLPRLYPAFHAALLVLTLVASALGALFFSVDPRSAPTRAPAIVAALGLAAAAIGIAWSPTAARRIQSADNLRLVLLEHAPLLGRGVWLAAKLAPPAPIEEAPALATGPGEIPRALDWTGRDVILISVDALRADHVSAYGYGRPTTPNLDALAREGALFEAAYCPTPHTSYSVTSMMTGKYMRPLLAVGLGEDSETWAALMRRYGYRTTAFYPPAVFFIDRDRFTALRERGLDFEYRKEEFAAPALRASQVHAYLEQAPADRPMFMWVHFFEPHEPYVMHPEHPFGAPGEATDIDAYDSEIAAADVGIGAIVRDVRSRRPSAVVIVTADHGEEFGEHGGRYHGTTVYEEQARVPLVIVGPGVVPGRVRSVAQTIDLLPTVVSALGIPRPARLRGRDLGPLLARKPGSEADPGLAFAETDEYTLLARGDARLVCARRANACNLYDRASDPDEHRSLSADKPELQRELRRAMASVAAEHGRFESGEATQWPEALRRGMAGDAEAAVDVAALLDDASAAIRLRAAEALYDLHASDTVAQMRRAADRSEDDAVRRWCALALVRAHDAATPRAEAMLGDADPAWRRRAALAFAESKDDRGAPDLVAWWSDREARQQASFERTREILAALGAIRARAAVPALVRELDDVRLRPWIAQALGAIGDPAARAPLLARLEREHYVTARSAEAAALVALGAHGELRPALARYAGLPEPMVDALPLAAKAAFLSPRTGGWISADPVATADATIDVPSTSTPLRLLVLTRGSAAPVATAGGAPLAAPVSREATGSTTHAYELGIREKKALAVHLEDPTGGLQALWIVARTREAADDDGKDGPKSPAGERDERADAGVNPR